ncbi:hypothetical protein ACE41H_15365 [Paenibacillus enshidis]|uniref:DUF4320 family protein n=1 Tax=Paenibacillus enshidis TaxID=1458439 RepID=A0ABV5AVA6_9BACL
MSSFKIMIITYLAIFLVLLSVDLGIYVKANESVKRTLDKAIDSGIILATDINDYSNGGIKLEQGELYDGVRSIFRDNLKLDSNLSNTVYKDGKLEVRMEYRSDGAPRVVAKFTCNVVMVSGRFIGLESRPMSVTKITPYNSEYK